MMLKSVSWDLLNGDTYHAEILNGPKATFEKNAAAFEGEYSPEIIQAIDKLEVKPAHTYLLINAMGAGEFYGSNKNHDYFPEKVLREYHKTFEALAYVYKHHVNKDPRRSYGKVIFSFYNEKMHRVELIVEVSNEKTSDVLNRIANGENVAVSMGCRVPWDECSVCGNRAKTRREYCVHLRRGTAGRVTPDGQKPYAINWQPKFFDISFVTIPADPTASVMAKVASKLEEAENFVSSTKDMEEILKSSGVKEADIVKRIDGKVEVVASDPKRLIPKLQDDLPKEEIKDILSETSLSKLLSTLLAMRIMPKKNDFQRMVLYSIGRHNLADQLDSMGYEFPVDESVEPVIPMDLGYEHFSPEIGYRYRHWMPTHSLTKPLVIIRMIKAAEMLEEPQQVVNYKANEIEQEELKELPDVSERLAQRLMNTKQASDGKIIRQILNHMGQRKVASVPTIIGGLTKIAESPDPKNYTGQKGDMIVQDLNKVWGWGASQIQPWMMTNNLWDSAAVTQYNTNKWTLPWSDYSGYDKALSDPYGAAKYIFNKGYKDAENWNSFSTAYGYEPISEEINKNLSFIANPPAQNVYKPFGLKGYQALAQERSMSSDPKDIAKAMKAQQDEEKANMGRPTAQEEAGKLGKPRDALNKISAYLEKKSKYEYIDPNLSTPLEEAGKAPMLQSQKPDFNGVAPEKNPFFAVTGLGALYVGYKRLMDLGASKDLPKLEKTIIRNPWMLPLLAGGVGLGTVAAQKALLNKEAGWTTPVEKTTRTLKDPGMLKSIVVSAVPSYFYSGAQEVKMRRGEQLNEFEDFVRKHPFITTLGTLGLVRGGIKSMSKTSSVEEIVSNIDKNAIDELYTQIIS